MQVDQQVQQLVKSATTYDTFGNCNIDITKMKEFADKTHARALRTILTGLIEAEKSNGKHVCTLKFAATQTRLDKYLKENGFVSHQANPEFSLVTKCLKDHDSSDCSYPKHKTTSIGVMGVVFNKEKTRFLAIQENSGPYRGWKPPTGSVDYELGQDPLSAVVRELEEEANLKLDPKAAGLVAYLWTSQFRGTNPDINFVYAFQTDEADQQLKAQATEIQAIKWLSVEEFLSKTDNPLVFKDVVTKALTALKSNQGWHQTSTAWGSGKVSILNS